jgi:hypothetical protein
MSLWTVALLVFLVNLPFGYWRASARRLAGAWFLALLLPLLLVVTLKIYSGLGWKWLSLPVLVGALCLGQFVGGRLRNIIQGRGPGRAHH